MKTGAELVNFKSFNAQNKQSISDFQTLKSREIADVVKTSSDIFDNEIEIEDEIEDEQFNDNEAEIDTVISLPRYNSYTLGATSNENIILRFFEFK